MMWISMPMSEVQVGRRDERSGSNWKNRTFALVEVWVLTQLRPHLYGGERNAAPYSCMHERIHVHNSKAGHMDETPGCMR